MHATLIKIPPEEVRSLGLQDRYKIHQYLWSTYFSDRQERDFIFKTKTYDGQKGLTLLVFSRKEPLGGTHLVRTREVNKTFEGKHSYHTQINPTKKVQGKIIALTSEEDIKAWWTRKALSAGFSVESCILNDISTKKFRKKGVQGTLVSATLSGTLSIMDPAAFQETLVSGVGRGKAMGMGLLEIGN